MKKRNRIKKFVVSLMCFGFLTQLNPLDTFANGREVLVRTNCIEHRITWPTLLHREVGNIGTAFSGMLAIGTVAHHRGVPQNFGNNDWWVQITVIRSGQWQTGWVPSGNVSAFNICPN